jgi:hypothetical protein
MQRRLVADQLVERGVLPIGMEILPASGDGTWEVIRSAIDASDFYVIITAGRYGSIAPAHVSSDGLSWTELEYRYARRRGKPVIAFVHSDPESLPSSTVDDRTSKVWQFRNKLKEDVLVRLFANDTDLVAGLHTSLMHLMEAQRWGVPTVNAAAASGGPDLEGFLKRTYDRRYSFISAIWSHEISRDHPGRWDATCVASRTLRPHWPEGLSSFSYLLNKPSGDYAVFFTKTPPRIKLLEIERSEPGDAAFRERPRRLTPSSYVHDLDFRPALRQGELCTLRYQSFLPGYRFADRDSIREASTHAAAGVRDYEICSFDINYPTDRLVLSVSFPDSLGVDLIDFRVRKNSTFLDADETSRVEDLEAYRRTTDQRGSDSFIVATLDIPNPCLKRTYELRWHPPSRGMA